MDLRTKPLGLFLINVENLQGTEQFPVQVLSEIPTVFLKKQ